jgi:hypothetical protein
MALNKSTLTHVQAGPNRLFVYGSGDDALATVSGAGYFNDAAGTLEVGDVIVVAPDAGTAGLVVVTSNDGSTVVVA